MIVGKKYLPIKDQALTQWSPAAAGSKAAPRPVAERPGRSASNSDPTCCRLHLADDAGVYRLTSARPSCKPSIFSPPCRRPYTFGAIAAANSLSDVYAMGGSRLPRSTSRVFPRRSRSRSVQRDSARRPSQAADAGCTLSADTPCKTQSSVRPRRHRPRPPRPHLHQCRCPARRPPHPQQETGYRADRQRLQGRSPRRNRPRRGRGIHARAQQGRCRNPAGLSPSTPALTSPVSAFWGTLRKWPRAAKWE